IWHDGCWEWIEESNSPMGMELGSDSPIHRQLRLGLENPISSRDMDWRIHSRAVSMRIRSDPLQWLADSGMIMTFQAITEDVGNGLRDPVPRWELIMRSNSPIHRQLRLGLENPFSSR